MEHRQLPPQASHAHEALLGGDEPVRNQLARSEALLQAKLDVATSRMNDLSAQNRLSAQKEMNAAHQRVQQELAGVIAGTPGLRVVDPSAWGPRPRPALASSAPATSTRSDSRTAKREASLRASGVIVNPTAADRAAAVAAASARATASATRLVSSNGTSAGRTVGPARTTRNPASTRNAKADTAAGETEEAAAGAYSTGRRATLSVDAGAAPSNYTFGFPTPFPESGFQSVVRWADVSFQEAQVAAVGPRANLGALRAHDMPNRVVVTVACYLLNEVLSRDANLQPLWSQLRAPIFDAIFSPELLASHFARHQAQLSQREARTTADEGSSVLPPLPARVATYEDVSDYANYRLWTEETVGAYKDNHRLHERVRRLKDVVAKSRLVLLMAQRRVDTAKKRAILLAWHAHTVRVNAQREVVSAYVTESHKRRLSETSFLRWRRLTVQNKLDEVRGQYHELHKKWQTMADTHRLEVHGLKEKLTAEELERQTAMVRDAALRAQINDSYAMESKALRTALSLKQDQCEHLLDHARRWERLAKTFRPRHVAPPVPKQLLTFGIQMCRFEDEFSSTLKQNTRVFRLVNVRSTMTKFLLRWTNAVMTASPYKNMWVNVKRLATRRDHADARADSGNVGPAGSAEATTVMVAAAPLSDAEAFGSYSLIFLVRELRRLLDRERQERCASAALQSVLGGPRNGLGTSGTLSSSFSASKARQWLTELVQPTSSRGTADGSLSDSDMDEGGEAIAAGGEEEGGDTASAIGSGYDNARNPDAALHRQLFTELCEVLYLLTEEGSRPSLLMHCPYLGSFFSTAMFDTVPAHPTAMLWILATLFTGYVETLCSFQNPHFRGQWPPYLRCGNEDTLAHRPNPALTSVVSAEDMGLRHGTLSATAGPRRAVGSASVPATETPAAGSFVLSRDSTVGKKPAGGGPGRRQASVNSNSGLLADGGGGGGGDKQDKSRKSSASSRHVRRQGSMHNLSRALPTKSMRVTSMTDLELVRRGVDREDDILAYLGRDEAQEAFLQNVHGEETDIEALMVGLDEDPARSGGTASGRIRDTLTARARRQERRRQQLRSGDAADTIEEQALVAFAGETVLDSDDDDEGSPPPRPSPADSHGLNRSSSFYTELTAIAEPRAREAGTGAGDARVSADAGDVSGDDEALSDLGLRDDVNYLRAVLRAQGMVEAEKATSLLVSPKKDLFSAEELYTLLRLPPPSTAFDARRVLVRRDLKAVTSANTSYADSITTGVTRNNSTPPPSTAAAAVHSSTPLQDAQPSASSQRTTSMKEPTTSISAFLTYTLLDVDRRQLWQGMARVVTSLITRLRVLDTATSTNTTATAVSSGKVKAWKQRKSEITSQRSGRSASNRSASSRSSSFVGLPDEDDATFTTARLAKPVRVHGGQTTAPTFAPNAWPHEGVPREDNGSGRAGKGGLTASSSPSTHSKRKLKKATAESSPSSDKGLATPSPPAATALPPILQHSSPARATGSGPPPPPTTAATSQLGEALREYGTDNTHAAPEATEESAGSPTRASTAPSAPAPITDTHEAHTAAVAGVAVGQADTRPDVPRAASAGDSAVRAGDASHGLVVRTQHSNAGHYTSPPPIAPGVPGDVRVAGPLTVSTDTGASQRSGRGVAHPSGSSLSRHTPTTTSSATTTAGQAGRAGGPQLSVPRTAPPGVNPQTLEPLVVHAGGSVRDEASRTASGPTSTSTQPTLPHGGAGTSKFRFNIQRGK